MSQPATPELVSRGDAYPWVVAALALAVFIVTMIGFAPTLSADFVQWDDHAVIVENPHIRGFGPQQLEWMFTTRHAGHWQPVTWLTYAADYTLWGMDPTGYHLTSNLFHAANALLVFLLARLLLRRGFGDGPRRWMIDTGAVLAALLFALHPLRVESVAWATERRDVVSSFFLLLTLLAWWPAVAGPRRRPVWMVIALVIYTISMMAKVGGAPLFVVLLVLDWFPLRRLAENPLRWLGRGQIGLWLEKVPFLVIALIFAYTAVNSQVDVYLLRMDQYSMPSRAAQAMYGLVFYAWKTLLPTGLLPLYELHIPLRPLSPRYIVSAVIVAVSVVVLLLLRRRCPGALAAGLCYAALLGPVLGFFQNGPQIVADRYSYLSCLGWTILAAGGATWLLARSTTTMARAAVLGTSAIVVVVLGTLNWQQALIWHDSESLWGNMIERDPGSYFANNGWGGVLLEQGRVEEALPYFENAVAITSWYDAAWFNIWNIHKKSGDRAAYEASLAAAVEQSTLERIQAEAIYRQGNVAMDDMRYASAVKLYRQALEKHEILAAAHVNLAVALARLREPAEAETHFRRAIELDGNLLTARLGLATLLEEQGRREEAAAVVTAVLEMAPDNEAARAAKRRLR